MKLRSLSLQKFRQHRETTLQFPDGVIGIIGPNGSGKSTIIEAIGFALYGSKAIRGTLDTVRTADEVKGAVVAELSFEQDGVLYRVERTTADAKLFVSGGAVPTVKGGREVTERMRILLGMSYDEFISTFYTEQKGLEFLSQKKGGSERERFILRMIGYDRLEKVQEKLRDERKALKNQLIGLEQGNVNKEELQEELKKESKALQSLHEEIEASQKTISEQDAIAAQLKKIFESVAAERAGFEKLSKELQATEAVYQERTGRLNSLNDERKALLALIKTAEKKLELNDPASEKILEEVLREIKSVEVAIQEEDRNNFRLTASCEAEVTSATKASKTIEEKISNIKTLGSSSERCPTCGQGLGEGVEEAVMHLQKELEKAEQRVLEAQQKLAASKTQTQKITQLKEKQSELIAKREHLQPVVIELQELKKLQDKIKVTDDALSSLREGITESDNRLRTLRADISKIPYSEAKYTSERVRYEAQSALLTNLRMERLRKEGDLKERKGRIEKLEGFLQKLKTQEELLTSGKDKLLNFEEGDTVLTEFRKQVVTSLRPRLSEAASDLLYELTEGRYTTVEFTEDFTPHISEDGEMKKVISGGEEDILHLCVRLGLSQLLAERSGKDFSLLILDEVFGSLDESRRSNLLQLLSRLTNRFEQIIIISHFDDVKDSVDNVIGLSVDEASGSSQVVVASPVLDFFDEKTVNL